MEEMVCSVMVTRQNKTKHNAERGHWGQAIGFVLLLFSFISLAVTKHPKEK